MEINYFEDFVKLLNEKKVKYCIIGGFAVAHHGWPRDTTDIDFFIEPTPSNGKKILEVLVDFSDMDYGLKADNFCEEDIIFRLGKEPNKIELFTSIPGVDFATVWKNKEVGIFRSQKAYYIGLDEFIKNKESAGRHIDKADLEFLREVEKQK